MGHSTLHSQQIIVALAKFDLLVFTLEIMFPILLLALGLTMLAETALIRTRPHVLPHSHLGLTTYSGGKNTGHVMTDALEWTQTQHAGAIESYIFPGDHRRVKRSPVLGPLNPINFPLGVKALKVAPVGKKLVPIGKVNIAL